MVTARFHLPPFAALRAFEAYGRAGSVRRAGELLSVDQAIISRHLRSLEDRLGIALINRPKGGLTERGRAYHTELTAAFIALEQATRRAASAGSNSVRIWSAPGFAYHWLTARLRDFQTQHPDIVIELKSSDVPADFTKDEADADIRFVLRNETSPETRDVRHVELASPYDFPVASPQVARGIRTLAELSHAPLLFEDGDIQWRLWFASHGLTFNSLPHVAQLWHAHLTLAAACAGQGVALANDFIAARHLADGSLVRLGGSSMSAVVIGTYMLLIPRHRENQAATILLDWLVETDDGYQRDSALARTIDHTD